MKTYSIKVRMDVDTYWYYVRGGIPHDELNDELEKLKKTWRYFNYWVDGEKEEKKK
jgi:hypothetical protein